MRIIEVQFAPWDQSYFFKPQDESGQNLDFKKGDEVVVKTTVGTDLGKVMELGEFKSTDENNKEIKNISRKALPEDKLKYLELNKNNKEMLKFCRQCVKKLNLDMKLVDVHVSFDEQRIVFAFIADGRVDFRDLVKELTRKYQKTIRLQQIGVRDEAKVNGDFGQCGRCLCCKTYLEELGNVSTDYVKIQQVAHRGADRLSGACGRLKCCLRYEQPMYEELIKGMPSVGEKIKTPKGTGTVISCHTLKGTCSVNLGTREESNIIEVEIKKK